MKARRILLEPDLDDWNAPDREELAAIGRVVELSGAKSQAAREWIERAVLTGEVGDLKLH